MTSELNPEGLLKGNYIKKNERWRGIPKRRINTLKYGGLE